MSNRKGRQMKAVNPTAKAAISTQPPPGLPATLNSTPPMPTLSRWRSRMGAVWSKMGLGGVAIILSVVGLCYTHCQTHINSEQLEEVRRQNDLAEYNQLRATGGITAQTEFATFGPTPNDFGKNMRIAAFGGVDKPYYKDIDTFLKFRPTLVLNNIGEEPIEAIRVVTSRVSAEIDLPNQPSDKDEFGLLLREEEREDITLSQQWLPETSVQISLLKGILGQMVQIQGREKQDAMHKATMQVQISSKITGSTVFSRGEDRKIACVVWWMPSGFPEDKCREVLNGYQSKVGFGPKRPISIRRIN